MFVLAASQLTGSFGVVFGYAAGALILVLVGTSLGLTVQSGRDTEARSSVEVWAWVYSGIGVVHPAAGVLGYVIAGDMKGTYASAEKLQRFAIGATAVSTVAMVTVIVAMTL